MRQLITRVDEELHERVRRGAAAQGVSMNALVVTAIERLLVGVSDSPAPGEREQIRERARLLGLLTRRHHAAPDPADRDRLIAATRGLGPALSDALEWDRGPR